MSSVQTPKQNRKKILMDLNFEIENANKRILSLKENWDGEGSVGYTKETWESAVDVLKRLIEMLIRKHHQHITIPDIMPGPEGSIDLYWKSEETVLLINIRKAPNTIIGFYGEKFGHTMIKGTFERDDINDVLLLWLKKYHVNGPKK